MDRSSRVTGSLRVLLSPSRVDELRSMRADVMADLNAARAMADA